MKKQKHDNNDLSLKRYVFISLLVLVCALLLGGFIGLFFLLIDHEEKSISVHIVGMLEGIIGAFSTCFVLYQLRTAELTEQHQDKIEEATFLLRYNMTFIQDRNMQDVEHLLEGQAYYDLNGQEVITKENRQKFVNYLVYLEGLAPLVIDDVLTLDHIDNLMSYRFFLATDNKELQEKELKPYAEYYRGCFKLYKKWAEYKDGKKLHTPIDDCTNREMMQKLSQWERFDEYAE